MLTVDNLRKAQGLLDRRSGLESADLVLCSTTRYRMASPLYREAGADDELLAAIEAFRQRRLAALDQEMRDLGVDPAA